jgi:hypothetical protein
MVGAVSRGFITLDTKATHMGFVVNKGTLWTGFTLVLQFPPVNIVHSPALYTHISTAINAVSAPIKRSVRSVSCAPSSRLNSCLLPSVWPDTQLQSSDYSLPDSPRLTRHSYNVST